MSNFNASHFYRELNTQIGLDLPLFLDIVEATDAQYLNGQINSYEHLTRLADYLGVSVEKIISNKIDYKVLRKRFLIPSFAISDKYLLEGGCYMDTVRYMLSFFRNRYGEKAIKYVLSQLQIEERVIYNDQIMVNLNFLNDLFKVFEKLGMNQSEVFSLASYVNLKARRAGVLALLKDKKTDFEILDTIVQNQKSYDANFDYQLFVDGKTYCLQGIRREHGLSEENEYCVHSLNLFKAATIQKAPTLINKSSLDFIDVNTQYRHGKYTQNFIFKETCLVQ